MDEYKPLLLSNGWNCNTFYEQHNLFSAGKISQQEFSKCNCISHDYPIQRNYYTGQRDIIRRLKELRKNTNNEGLQLIIDQNIDYVSKEKKFKPLLHDIAEFGIISISSIVHTLIPPDNNSSENSLRYKFF
jgi:hypothetical protein